MVQNLTLFVDAQITAVLVPASPNTLEYLNRLFFQKEVYIFAGINDVSRQTTVHTQRLGQINEGTASTIFEEDVVGPFSKKK